VSAVSPTEPEPREIELEHTPSAVRGTAGRYQLCCELATGGMATVYLARAEGPGGFDKIVALKRIHPHLAREPEFVEMFLDEARLAARIQHPNVCGVFDFGQASGTYYIAMEYLLGETLQTVLARIARRPAFERPARWLELAALLVSEAAEGLHAAHELRDDKGELLNVVHRDVSPPNLFVGYDGIVKVVDFGIARARNRMHATTAGTIKGKYTYMAPEQASRGELDRRADVWSLGVVLWELLTCRRLFRRDREAETIMAVCTLPIPRPSEVDPTVPAELDAIVMRALTREIAGRYATAREMGRDLRRFLQRASDPMTPVELADWMQTEFGAQRTKRQALVDQARTDAMVAIPRAPREDDSVRLGDGVPDYDVPVEVEAPLTSVDRMQSPPSGRRLLLGGAAALGLIALAAVGAVVLGTGPGPGPGPTASGPPRGGTSRAVARGAQSPPQPPTRAVADRAPPPRSTPEIAQAVPPTEPPRRAVTTKTHRTPRPRTGPAEPPTTGTPGTVAIVTPGGWADVYLGSRWLGRAPGRITLPAGDHVLSLRPFGREPSTPAAVSVRAGENSRLSVPIRH